jgi:ATP-dependent exoDNAse (exonuclease V) beta subunit
MSNLAGKPTAPDHIQRDRALDPARSILVQAPAGSGKTTLLTDRFISLLGEVDDPDQVVAITFTNAAAGEMRTRILDELRKDEPSAAARRALERSNALGWKLLDLPAQLRISTIDSFCRDLALQQPLLSGFGGGLAIAEQPAELYRRAARQTLEQIDEDDPSLTGAIAALLEWRDNNWQEMEDLLVQMLSQRDRWMHDFLLEREPEWEALRGRLERPFANAVRETLNQLDEDLGRHSGACEEAMALARFACTQPFGEQFRGLAELPDFPCGPFTDSDDLDAAREAFLCLATMLLTLDGTFRKSVDKRLGFPADRKHEKARLLSLIGILGQSPELQTSLRAVRELPPARYTEEDWVIVRACFTLLRHAAGQLQVVFAEAAAVDFIQVAQIAQGVLRGPDGEPTEAALAVADGIRHLLVDEFQDTSRRQHQLLASLVAAWPDRVGRTCFLVGDPMQSIYFFRDADAELFARVKEIGLEIPNAEPLVFDFVSLTANFRTEPSLVERLNGILGQVFAADDGSGVEFFSALPAREPVSNFDPRFKLHLRFQPQIARGKGADPEALIEKEAARAAQIEEIVALIQGHIGRMEQARAKGERYRIAVLGRARSALAPIAQALRQAAIPFRALDLEKLADRPEVLDALALARALMNPQDRVAWLGVLRAPWCGLDLKDLHTLTSADDAKILARPVPDLLAERLPLLSTAGRGAAGRVLGALSAAPNIRATLPTFSLGTWLEQLWLRLGGADCLDRAARANVNLLWSCLDRLPDGERDLLGPAFEAALDKLTAQPDPEAGSDCGVQLMTIHKSKGLEFEVVIVPELQAAGGRSRGKLLSWLERGLAEPDESGEITEFLIAPLQPKGEDRGRAKQWVDRVYRERESQEDRRVLYVCSTRARDELHLFARPSYKAESNDSFGLVEPTGSLLATAWPGFEQEVRDKFEEWKAAAAPIEAEIESIAASAESNLLVMSSAIKPTLLHRLPVDYRWAASPGLSESGIRKELPSALDLAPETWDGRLYARHQGGLLSRALGAAVHTLLEELARRRTTQDWNSACATVERFEPRIAAQVRASGVDQTQAAKVAAEALQLALNASHDPNGQWILSPHTDAESEVRWTGVVAGRLTTVRVDRVFRAGVEPLSEGQDAWWIVDYKTAHAELADQDRADAMLRMREEFAPQLEAYAQILRNLHGAEATVRAGLYYPRMLLLDWWEL